MIAMSSGVKFNDADLIGFFKLLLLHSCVIQQIEEDLKTVISKKFQ